MSQSQLFAQQLQAIETHLHQLTAALQEGKFPVNLQNISQVFDSAIAAIPRLNLPPEKFCETYNDLPTLLTAYAIAVTLNADSYRQTNSQQIVFDRLYNGNYWIIPIAATPLHAWLVPNPTRQIDLTRFNSLPFAFDWPDQDQATHQDTFTLVEPALVSTLPTTPLTWKLLKRGAIRTFLPADARAQQQSISATLDLNHTAVATLVEQKIQERLAVLENQLFDRLAARLQTLPTPTPIATPPANSQSPTPANSIGDLWRQSLTDIMLEPEPAPDSPLVPDNIIEAELITSELTPAQKCFEIAMEKVGNFLPAAALQNFDKAIAMDSQYADAYFQRALLKKNQLKDTTGALKDFRQAATLYQQQGLNDQALNVMELIISLGF